MDKINKKKILIIAGLVIVVALVFLYQKGKQDYSGSSDEIMLQKQKEELDRLRQQAEPISEEEMKSQKQKLDELRKEQSTGALSQEELDKQKEELDRLRSLQQQ